jgi:predicted MFS family arabinose efflux permease
MEKTDESHLGRMLAVILFSRINIVSAFRTTYPFLPVISRGLGISFQTGSLLVTVRSLAGLFGLVAGPLGERLGYRTTMVLGLVLFGVGVLLVASVPIFWTAMVAFTLIGMAKATYDPAMRAYLSTRVPYNQRGRAIGAAELSWAGGWFLGAPVCGYLIGCCGWRSPWVLMSILVVPGLFVTAFLPRSSERPEGVTSGQIRNSVLSFVRVPSVLGALAMSALIYVGSEQFFVVYGAWMEHVFGLGPMALGGVSVVIGVSELAGELGVTFLTDRLGKRRSLGTSLLLVMVFYLFVPLVGFSLSLTLLGLGLLIFVFEFLVVSNVVFISELVPERRNLMLASLYVTATVSQASGAFVGPRLWGATENLVIQGLVSVLAMGGAFLIGKLMVFD